MNPADSARTLLRKEGQQPSKRDLDRALVFALLAIAEELKTIRETLETFREAAD